MNSDGIYFFLSYLMESRWEEMTFQLYEPLTEATKYQYVTPCWWYSSLKLEAKEILVLDENGCCHGASGSSKSHLQIIYLK